MDKHHGNIVEYVVRKNGFSITELAIAASVNRRTIYNWFQQPELKKNFIQIIGQTIRHDFSKEFPELFTFEDFREQPIAKEAPPDINCQEFKDKYISLLEIYNQLLLKRIF